MKQTAAWAIAFVAMGCSASAAPAPPKPARSAPPPPIPGKAVPGCVTPPPTKPETVENEETVGTLALALRGQKATREEARKEGRAIAVEVEEQRLNPDPVDRLKSCATRLGDVVT